MYDDDRDALAAEYVLGTLSADERDQAEALLVIDPGFAEIVRVWERRLGELNVMVEAVEPPPELWDRIKTEIDGAEGHIAAEAAAALPAIGEAAPHTAPEAMEETAPEPPADTTVPDLLAQSAPSSDAAVPDDLVPDLLAPSTESSDVPTAPGFDDSSVVAALASSLLPSEQQGEAEPPAQAPSAPPAPKIERSADVIHLTRQARRWRGFTVAMSAIAALLAIYVAVGQLAPALLPAGRLAQSAALVPPPSSRLVAVLQQEPTAPAFLLTVDPQSRTMTVRRMTATAGAGRSYELWLISGKDPKPQSLGLIGGEEFTTRPLPADFDVGAMPAASYAVSLEPAGGSKSGAPSGPVLFTGKMVEAVPGSPPSKT